MLEIKQRYLGHNVKNKIFAFHLQTAEKGNAFIAALFIVSLPSIAMN